MTWSTITINQLNLLQGETSKVERKLLFIGNNSSTNSIAVLQQYFAKPHVNLSIDVSGNDEQTAYLMISVPLSEEIRLIEDENGIIPYKSKRYKLVYKIVSKFVSDDDFMKSVKRELRDIIYRANNRDRSELHNIIYRGINRGRN